MALRRCGGRRRSGAGPPPTARPRRGLSGSAAHVLWGRVCGRGSPALSLWLACPVRGCVPRGGWEVVQWGWPPTVVRGVWCQGYPSPGRPSLGAGSQDPLPVCPGPGWCGHGGPSTGPTACALASRRCTLWGRPERAPGGGALGRCEGRLRSGAGAPAARRRGGLSGSAAHVLWARVCGRGGPALFLWLACPVRGCLPRGRWEAVPGGRPPTVVRGVWCQGCFSPGRPFLGGGQPGPVALCPRHGWGGHRGASTGPTACALASRRCALWGWPEGVPGGGALRCCEGRLRSGAGIEGQTEIAVAIAGQSHGRKNFRKLNSNMNGTNRKRLHRIKEMSYSSLRLTEIDSQRIIE